MNNFDAAIALRDRNRSRRSRAATLKAFAVAAAVCWPLATVFYLLSL